MGIAAKFTYRDGISVLQIVAFAPAILCAIALMRRHGITLAWWLMTMFTMARLVGASAQLITISHPGVGAEITILVTLYLGISPLVFMFWSILLRVNEQVRKPMPLVIFWSANMVNLLALGIGSYGSYKVASSSISTGRNVANGFADAALIIFAVIFALSIVFFAFLRGQMSTIPVIERVTLHGVSFGIPLLAVRIAYALTSDFAHQGKFNIYSGSQTIYLCMDVLEEIVIVYIFVIVGFRLPRLPKPVILSSDPEPPSDSRNGRRTRKERRPQPPNSVPLTEYESHTAPATENQQIQQQSRAKTAQGPITWIYYTIVDRRRGG